MLIITVWQYCHIRSLLIHGFISQCYFWERERDKTTSTVWWDRSWYMNACWCERSRYTLQCLLLVVRRKERTRTRTREPNVKAVCGFKWIRSQRHCIKCLDDVNKEHCGVVPCFWEILVSDLDQYIAICWKGRQLVQCILVLQWALQCLLLHNNE